MKLKFDPNYSVSVGDALAPYAQPLMAAARTGKRMRLMIVGELAPGERTEPAPGQDKEPALKLVLVSGEVAAPDQEDTVRQVQRALYLERTAQGTLDEEGQVVLPKQVLDAAGDHVALVALAKLRAGVDVWAKEARKAVHNQLSAQEMWLEMQRQADGLSKLLDEDPETDDGGEAEGGQD
ncbi:hypothetical protein [Streptomonospora litoralis]|uniref:Uncharacterized protein n=1 Tax=Streptomonospora litoralis TaxID=2498135 RepID=A0A4P6Q7T5_9ACTN|nr:hypothetical protein [Streptomonospora litoralis]QBI56866.1 hypothetical protein EKD16_25630 [Streptomonospora litoralis]